VGRLPDTRGGAKDVLIILAVLAACLVFAILFWALLEAPTVGVVLSVVGVVLSVIGFLRIAWRIARNWNHRGREEGSA
jgi:hypothetical protein